MKNINNRIFIGNSLRLVYGEKKYFVSFLILAFSLTILYLFLLPSLPDGAFTLFAIQFITPIQILFSFVFGILFGLVIVLNVLAYRVRVSTSKKLSFGALLATLVNGLCCTPVIPSLIALTGVSTPVLFKYAPPIEIFFENYSVYFYVLSSGLLLFSVNYLSKNIACCANKPTDRKLKMQSTQNTMKGIGKISITLILVAALVIASLVVVDFQFKRTVSTSSNVIGTQNGNVVRPFPLRWSMARQ